jgi:hypothetical protein
MRITTEHFLMFKTYFETFADLFNLGDWDIDIFNEDDPKRPNALATTSGLINQHQATIRMAKSWPKHYVNQDQIKRVALHECLEVVCMELRVIAEARYISRGEIDRAVHVVIQRLSNLLLQSLEGE